MEFNFYAVLVAAVVPMVLGFIWYNPKVFGNVWMREAGVSEEQLKSVNMALILGVSFLLAILLAFFTQLITIHQMGAVSMIGGDPNAEGVLPSFHAFMKDYGGSFRTYKHGALHGVLAGIFLAFPLIGINSLFERKSWTYILINSGYWTLTLTVMGAIVCGWV